MKRIMLAVCAGLFCAGLFAAPAQAAVRHFHGSVAGGGTVDFDVLFRNGDPKLAGNFDFEGIPVTCNERNTRVNFSTSNAVNVAGRANKFVYVFRGFNARVAGRTINHTLDNRVVRATGKVRYGPNDFEESGLTGCTTGGARNWNAHT